MEVLHLWVEFATRAVFIMRKILTSVEIREDKLQLHFNYNDNSYGNSSLSEWL
jgi:hypothetical protein